MTNPTPTHKSLQSDPLDDLGDDESALDHILRSMNVKTQQKPRTRLPEPEIPMNLSPEQLKVLAELPEEDGFYWVENIQSNERSIARVTRENGVVVLDHWGHRMTGAPTTVQVIERWLIGWSFLDPVAAYTAPKTYEENERYGMF